MNNTVERPSSLPQQQQQQQLQYQQYQQQQQQQHQQQQQLIQHQDQSYSINKLICSFKSGLPNEIDFGMQVAKFLANTDNFTWSRDYPLVDAICLSLPVFICVCDDLSNCYCYPRFWLKILKNEFNDNPYLQAATLRQDTELSFTDFNKLKSHEVNDHIKIYRRIKSAAELLKQFSMTTGMSKSYNDSVVQKKKLAASPPLLKFVSLLMSCNDAPLNLIGLDILSNVAAKLANVMHNMTCIKLIQMFQEYCVECITRQDGDIYIVNRSIEVVSRLISSERISLSFINLITEKNLVHRIEQLLTSHYDVSLLLSALECCYRISRHQPHLLTSGRTKYLLKILVNLLNCDDSRFFTSTALKRIKLVEEEGGMHQLTSRHPPQQSNNSNHQQTPQPVPKQQPLQSKQSVPQQQQCTQQPQQKQAPPPVQLPVSQSQPPTETQQPLENQQQEEQQQQPPLPSSSEQHQKQPQPPQEQQPPKNDTSTTSPPLTQTTTMTESNVPVKEYICEWNNCGTKFLESKKVYNHVFQVHIEPLATDSLSSCLWSSPNGSGPGCITKRPKFSLLTHLNDFHCNPAALERSKPIKPPEHPGYTQNAALLAIRRHANSQNGKQNLQNHSPLSISVRLTSALILRNLATESSEVKQALENHEPLLSEICMTNGRDEAKIIAECLSLLRSQ